MHEHGEFLNRICVFGSNYMDLEDGYVTGFEKQCYVSFA